MALVYRRARAVNQSNENNEFNEVKYIIDFMEEIWYSNLRGENREGLEMPG